MNWFKSRQNVDNARLPPGDLGRSVVGHTFTFHNDAQGMIMENVNRFPASPIYRAKVIGRDVAFVVDHAIATEVLDSDTSKSAAVDNLIDSDEDSADSEPPAEDGFKSYFSSRQAYDQLIAAFFTEPNILLEDLDEPMQKSNRRAWEDHMRSMQQSEWPKTEDRIRSIVLRHRREWQRKELDLYRECKALCREIVFGAFLGLNRSDQEVWDRASSLSDRSLRGQFSIPVKANMGNWLSSTYSRGLQSQEDFRRFTSNQISRGKCPFADASTAQAIPPKSMVTHTSMFASSLVVKAMASYLTFCLLQLTRPIDPRTPWSHIQLETERLCPAIIGVLRRLTTDWAVPRTPFEVPEGWDVWLYFPLINRDTSIYGSDASMFKLERWKEDVPEPMSFGWGPKHCLGRDTVRRMITTVLKTLLGNGERLALVSKLDPSVQDFLGWRKCEMEFGWSGIKQLPVQRPRDPVVVRYQAK